MKLPLSRRMGGAWARPRGAPGAACLAAKKGNSVTPRPRLIAEFAEAIKREREIVVITRLARRIPAQARQ
jgi:hypothetical protein